jgi:hypothetical protein
MVWVWISIGVLAVWLLILTVVTAAIVRHLGTVTVVRASGQIPLASMDFDADGPQIGAAIPDAVQEVLARRQGNLEQAQRLVLFLSPGCGTCVDAAKEIAARTFLSGHLNIFALGTAGAAERSVAELLDALQPVAAAVSADDDARTALQGLQVNSVPFAISIDASRVVGKLFIRRIAQLREFLDEFEQQLTRPDAAAIDASGAGSQVRRTV